MPLCTFEFHCPRGTDANAQITIKFIIEQVIKKKCPEATLVNIRRGIHLETYGPAGILVKHPKGEHISGEYFHPKEKMWYNFHIYVCKNNKGKMDHEPPMCRSQS